jgi:predicted nucleic acid-binding protein
MPTYLLDTNIVSYLADPSSAFHERVAAAIGSLPDDSRLAVSVLTLYELAYGQERGPAGRHLLAIIRDEGVGVLAPSEAGAEVFARLKDAYRRHTGARSRDLVRHNVDLILASTALVEDAVLVSNDAIFATLAALEPRLMVENWAA